jgi:hypothetical protein
MLLLARRLNKLYVRTYNHDPHMCRVRTRIYLMLVSPTSYAWIGQRDERRPHPFQGVLLLLSVR